MSVQAKIEHDQDKIKMLIHDIEGLGEEKTDLRAPLFTKLKEEISLLFSAEEKIVYDAVNDGDLPKGLINKKEEVEALLSELDSLSVSSDEWNKKLSVLKARVFEQIDFEQEKLTPKIDEIIEDPELTAEEVSEHKDEQVDVEILELPKKA